MPEVGLADRGVYSSALSPEEKLISIPVRTACEKLTS